MANLGGGLSLVASSIPQMQRSYLTEWWVLGVSGASAGIPDPGQLRCRHGSVDQSPTVIRTGWLHMMDWLHMVEWTHTFGVLGVAAWRLGSIVGSAG